MVLFTPPMLSAIPSDTITVGWGKSGQVIIEDSSQYSAYYLTWFGEARVKALPDTNHNLGILDVKTPERQAQFITHYPEIGHDTPDIEYYWFKAIIRNISDRDINLWFKLNTNLGWYFYEEPGGGINMIMGGGWVPYDNTNRYQPRSKFLPHKLIPLHFKALETQTIYWRAYESTRMKHRGGIGSGTLYNDEYLSDLQEKKTAENISVAFVIGLIAAVLVFIAIMYVIYKDLVFLALALSALSFILSYLWERGLVLTTLLPQLIHVPNMYDLGENLVFSLRGIAFFYYATLFLKLEETSPGWHKALFWISVGLPGFTIIHNLMLDYTHTESFNLLLFNWKFMNLYESFIMIAFMFMGLDLSWKKVPMANIFLLGFIFLGVGNILKSLSNNFLNSATWATVDYWGTAIMFLTFSAALAYRMRLMDVQKQLAEANVIRIDQELKAANELDAMKTSFFTSISHEFRTPLTLIMSPLEKLYDETISKQKKERIGMILRNARRMQTLIKQILDLAKIQSSKMKLDVIEHDFAKHVKTIVAAHESLADSKEVSFKINIPDSKVPLYYDREMMNKIVNNLLSNAFKYCTADGEVILTVVQHDDEVELQIENSGKPISLQDQERIFDHFQRIEGADERIEGSGVGLSLVKNLMDLHHGKIGVRSEAEELICFTATFLPGNKHFKLEELALKSEVFTTEVKDSLPSSEPLPETKTDSKRGKEQPQILIVEDNQDMRQFISEELENTYLVCTAVNGRLGLEAARESIPDLIISDVMMPEMDGFTFLEKTRQDQLLCHIPIIMLTALSTDEAKFKGLETGADDYLLKPFNVRELRIRVANLIRQRERLRERFNLDQTLDLKELTVSSMDEKFLRRVMETIDENMADMDFSVKELSGRVHMSRSQLFRKLTALTNMTPTNFLRIQRLKRAASLLSQNAASVTEIAYMVGFQSPTHFASSFKKQYGLPPSKYSPTS